MIIEQKHIVGGLNVDDAYSVLPIEDYQNAENVRITVSEDGKVGVVKSVPGNSEVSNANYIEGTCIGSIEDKENQRCFYFIQAANSAIFCYRYQTNDIKLVLRESEFSNLPPNNGLLFPANKRITGLSIVGSTLYWTDDTNEPRRINVDRYIDLYEGAGILDFNDEDITIIRPQPVLPLQVEKLVSADESAIEDRTNNFIAEEAFQFSHRYVYEDYETSALSVYSELVNYNNDDDTTDYDTVKIQLSPYQVIPGGVIKVQILYRNGNTGSWSIIKELDPDDHTILSPLTFYFYNDRNGNPISDEVAYKPFDNVPIRSKALESARNRIFLGNNTFGYDPIDNLGITVAIDEITVGGTPESGSYWYTQYFAYNPSNSNNNISKEVILVVVSGGANDGVYILEETTAENTPGIGVPETYLPTTFETDFDDGNLSDIATTSSSARIGASTMSDLDILNEVFEIPAGWGWRASIDATYTGTAPVVYGLTGTPIEDGYRQWKRGSKYRFGIVFYDFAGRNNGVYTNDDMIITTPDRIYTQTVYNGNAVWDITAPGTDIPGWATHYQIVRTKNLFISFFLQHFTRDPQYVSKDDDGVYVFGTAFDNEETIGVAFDISRIDNDGLGYTYTEGDILKFFASDDSEREVLRIIDQQGKYVITEPIDLGDLNSLANEKRVGILEIYTPDKEEDIFYEVGQVFRVTNPGRYNRNFGTRSGNIPGDIYIKNRGISGEGNLAMECMNINDRHWTEWLTDIGRPNVILYDTGQEIRPTNICYSETYVQGTKVNGLSSFNALDFEDLDEQNGPIQKLVLTTRTQEYGSVMLAICKLETSSIYLGETQVVDNNGDSILATSGNVIGTINNLKGGYGTINPESVAELDGEVFFFDAINGKVVRYALNGLTPISDIKMSKFWSEVGKEYLIEQDGFFPAACDQFASEYLISVPALATPTREFLESSEELVDISGLGSVSQSNLGITVAEGDKYTISGFAGRGSLTATLYVYLADADGSNPVLVYNSTDESGEEIEYTATKSGIFTITAGTVHRVIISRLDKSPHSLFDAESKVLAYNIRSERWSDARTFIPDYFGAVPNLLLSFKDGKLYRHDSTNNTFYGTQYPSKLAVVFNQYNIPVKTCRIIHIQGNTAPYTHIRTEEYNIQSSDILASEYRSREGFLQGSVLRDKLSPNIGTTAEEKLLAGDPMRGQFPQVAFEWDTTDLEVYSVKMGYTPSSGHVR